MCFTCILENTGGCVCVSVCVCARRRHVNTIFSLQGKRYTCFQTLSGQTGSGHKNIVKVVLQPALEMDLTTPQAHTQISSVQFSRSVVSDSLRPRELQHTQIEWLNLFGGREKI